MKKYNKRCKNMVCSPNTEYDLMRNHFASFHLIYLRKFRVILFHRNLFDQFPINAWHKFHIIADG